MFGPSDFLVGGLLPALVAAIALLAAWKLTRCATTAWTAGAVAGIVIGHWALDAHQIGLTAAVTKSIQPAEARDWLPLVTLLAMVPAAFAGLSKLGSPLARSLRASLCVLLPWRLLASSVYLPKATLPGLQFNTRAWSTVEALGWIGGIASALLLAWSLVEINSKQPLARPWLRSLLAPLVTVGAAATVAMSGSFTYGQILGVLTAALAASAAVATILRLPRGPEAAAGPVVISFGSLLVTAYFFSDLKLLHASLLLVALTAALAPILPRAQLRTQTALRCVLCLAPLALAVLLAGIDFKATQVESQSNPYLNYQP